MKRMETKPAIVETPTFQEARCVLEGVMADPSGGCGLLIGRGGVGKTTVLQSYVSPERKLITLDPEVGWLRPGMLRLLEVLRGAADSDRVESTSELVRYCVMLLTDLHDRAAANGRVALLMFDECHYVSADLIEMMRSFHDRTKIPMVFAGNPAFESRVSKMEEFSSRIGYRRTLSVPQPSDIAALCRHHGMGAREQHYLGEIVQGGGTLRIVGKIIEHAKELAGKGPIRFQHLAEAAEEFS